jgi:hypothetical protein
MNSTCPQCFSQLANSEVGNLCISCGYLQRRHHNHTPSADEDQRQYEESLSPGNLEAPRGLDNLLFPDDPPNTPTPSDLDIAEPPEKDTINSEPPRIINHHVSSQYKRRLGRYRKALETPELESAIEPESSLEQPDIPISTEPTATTSEDYPSTPANQTTVKDQTTMEDQDNFVEVNEPHKPSPYMLNMSEVKSSSNSNSPEYHSPLHNSQQTNSKIEYHDQPASKESDQDSKTAMDRADALLAAASSNKKTSSSRSNYLIITITIILLLGVGTFLILSLVQKPKPTPQSPSVSNPPVSSQSISPTPSNLTESAKRDAERKDTLNTMAIALAAYKKNNGSYPSGNDIETLKILTSSNPPYLREVKNDPLSNPESNLIIKYGYNSDGSQFTLTASLENKQDSDAVNGLYVVKSP